MRIKNSNSSSSLLLYTVLGFLFFVAAQVDLEKMSTSAMEHREEYVDRFIGNAFP